MLSCLFIIFGIKIFVILVKSLMSLPTNAISALFSKKSELTNDFRDKNKFNFDKLIWLSLIITFGFCNFTTMFNSVELRYIFVFLNSNFTYWFTSFVFF